MKAPRETDLVRQCLQFLKLQGIFAWRQNSGAFSTQDASGKKRFVRFHSARGCSDILGVLPPHGRLLAVECKLAGNKTTAQQSAFLDVVRAAGGLAVVVYTLDDLVSLFTDTSNQRA